MKWRWIVCILVALNLVFRTCSACSKLCSCMWKNGKLTQECNYKNMTSLPKDIAVETQVLEFSGNNLQKLENKLFVKKHLINFQRIYLSNCKIKFIDDQTFEGLTNLVELDLSDNLIEVVPSTALTHCISLMKLTLSSNPIRTLKKFAFTHLSFLTTLELSNCQINTVEEGAFQGLHSLEWLRLDGNQLKTIPGKNTFPKKIKGIELQRNSWECDCHIQDLNAWLSDFRIPLSVDPICSGPQRLKGRPVKSIPAAELACLPDISPTTFYLELGEGKNVSLLCHVRAVPEATVSWWFQGQMLQNNTMVAPGVHLIYFVEEGSENKRSELFIYNANSDDNGTFICNAENAAGISQSNFTIKIILKEDPMVIIVSFPLEYFMYTVIGAAVLGLLVITIIIILIFKCHTRNGRDDKPDKAKEIVINYEQTPTKCGNDQANVEILPAQLKVNASLTNFEADMIFYETRPRNEPFRTLSPSETANQAGSPSSLRRYQLEQNPDLINGTDGLGNRREGDGDDQRNLETLGSEQVIPVPISCLRANRDFYLLDKEGYPLDYGLPKGSCKPQCTENYYRTLPCNRMKRHSAANPLNRFSREAEFLSRSVDSAPYDHYHTDVRYTADGYPERVPDALILSPPGTYVAEDAPTSLPCCSVQWPPYLPANRSKLPSITKRCVSAQTDAECEIQDSPQNNGKESDKVKIDTVKEVLVESPEEDLLVPSTI